MAFKVLMVKCTSVWGGTVDETLPIALEIARIYGVYRVVFEFNDRRIPVNADDSIESLKKLLDIA